MPFYKVTARPLLIEAADPIEAAMLAFRAFEDRTPNFFEVVGPDVEVNCISLSVEKQDEAITIDFGRKLRPRA